MTEVRAPVRILQSGKVYRQMFDAEVQLMKSLDASKTRLSRPSIETISLPNIDEKFKHTSNTKVFSDPNTLLNDRQKTWTEGMPNDAATENPVLYRQLSAAANHRLKSLKVDKEVEEVYGLPNVVETKKKNSDINERVSQKRKERHDQALEEMHNELCLVSNRAEPRITVIGENLQSQLKEDDIVISTLLKLIGYDEDLINFSFERLNELWKEVELHSTSRRDWIEKAHSLFNEVEDDRLESISKIFKIYGARFKKIAYLLSQDVHRLVEKEAMMINQSILANRRSYAKLHINLLEDDIEREVSQHRTWLERVKDWKKLNAELAVKQFTNFMKSNPIFDPPEVREAMKTFLLEQKKLTERRLNLFEQLKELKPPTSTKQTVYKWNTALAKCQEDLDDLHTRTVKDLHHKYEATCQTCLSEIDKYKQNLVLSNVCDEEEMNKIVTEHLLPQVGGQLKLFEEKLEEMDKYLEELATHSEIQIRSLFKFAQGAAHLWDNHQAGMVKQERTFNDELEQFRENHDTSNQEREMKLDVTLDRLRQESTEEALNNCLQQCMVMLSSIKECYLSFHTQQLEKLRGYPEVIDAEVARYQENVCKYFNLKRVKDKVCDEEETRASVSAPVFRIKSDLDLPQVTAHKSSPAEMLVAKKEDEETEAEASPSKADAVDETSKEIIVTDKGTAYFVLSSSQFIENPSMERVEKEIDRETEMEKNIEASSDSEKPSFLSEMPEYIENAHIDPGYITALKNWIRLSFLNHLDQWIEETQKNSEFHLEDKVEELGAELDLRLHLHAPRAKRIEIDVHNVRAAELVLHRERVNRHCKGITAALDSLKADFVKMTKNHDEEAIEFYKFADKIQSQFISATKSSKLESLHESLETSLDNYVDNVKTSLRNFRRILDTSLGKLRESNAQCARSFKLFCEGGNFSPDETIPLRKKLEKISQRVDSAEGAVMKDLEGMESRRIEHATELVNKITEKFRNHLVDLTLIEALHRWATNAQVLIKSEASYSNGMDAEMNDHLRTLKSRIDACEKPNFDKENVSPEFLHAYSLEILEGIERRAKYLNCLKTDDPLPIRQDEVVDTVLSPTELPGTVSDRRPPSVTLKSVVPVASRQSIEGGASLRSRQPSDDAAIGLIKTILRAPREKTILDVDDVRSTATGTTRMAPPSANSTGALSSRLGKNVAKTGQATSSTVTPDPPSSRKSLTNEGSGLVYRRRDTKFDIKLMVFGSQPNEASHMLAKINKILFDALDGMLSTAEIYYKQKGMRSPTRPELIQESFDGCAEKIIEKLLIFEKQADEFHNNSLQAFRQFLREIEYQLCNVPRLFLHDLLKNELQHLDDKQNVVERDFMKKEKDWKILKKNNRLELRPTLGHPDQEGPLKNLSELELKRQVEHTTGISEHADKMQSTVRSCATLFAENLTKSANQLLQEFDALLTIDDVLVGKVPPLRERTSVLIRRRADGYDIPQVAHPSFGVKPIIERGVGKWLPADYTKLDVDPENFPKSFSVVIETNHTTLPQAEVISQRDEVLATYQAAYDTSIKNLNENKLSRLKSEERWKSSWEESVKHVKNLYK